MRWRMRLSAMLLTLSLLLNGCGAGDGRAGSALPEKLMASAENAAPYKAPPMATVAFHPDLAEGNGEIRIDLSAAGDGYIAVSAVSDHRLKFQVRVGDWTYNYNLSSEGEVSFFPLQCGDGHYIFRVMENIEGSKYAQIYLTERDVVLLDEFQPFLRSSDYCKYDAESACVKTASDLAAKCSTKLEVISAVYAFVCKNIRYDQKKAETVQSGYLPDVDDTLSSRKGICFDYASLAAAMLRSQGIPTKIIFGNVAPDDLYHAWNMVYTEESGWITVTFQVDGETWNRVDLTFSANGASDKFIGDGSHYTDVYSY